MSDYTQGGVECIDALRAATINKPPFEAVCVANIIECLWRYEEKGGIEDVQTAGWYLSRLYAELVDKSNKYQLVGTPNGVGLKTPWQTIMSPKEGDMFNPNDSAREQLLGTLLKAGGYCPCQPQKTVDTMCPCIRYREEGKCICGLYVKVPTGGENSVPIAVVRTESDTEDGEKE